MMLQRQQPTAPPDGMEPYKGLDIPKKVPEHKKPELSPEWEDFNQATQQIKAGDRYSPSYGGLFDDRAGAEISPTVTASIAWNPAQDPSLAPEEQANANAQAAEARRDSLSVVTGGSVVGQTNEGGANIGGAIYTGEDAESVSKAAIADTLLRKEGLIRGLYKSDGLYHIGIGHLIGGPRTGEDAEGHRYQTRQDLEGWFGTSAFDRKWNALKGSAHTGVFSDWEKQDFIDLFSMKTKLTQEEAHGLYKHDLDKRINILKGDAGKGVGAEVYNSLTQDEKQDLVSAYYRGDLGGKTAEHIRDKDWENAIIEGFRNYEMYKKLKPNGKSKEEWGALDEAERDTEMREAGAYEFSKGGVRIMAVAEGSPVQERLVPLLKIAQRKYNIQHKAKGGRAVVSNKAASVSQLRNEDGTPFKTVNNGSYVKILNTEPFEGVGGKRTWAIVDGERVSIPVDHISANLGQMRYTDLNLRADRSTSSSIVYALKKEAGTRGPQLEIRGVDGNWVNVWWTKGKKTHKGWVSKELINYNEHLASSILPSQEGVA